MKSDQAVDNDVKLFAEPDCSLCQQQPLSLKLIIGLIKRGLKEDSEENYELAARFYEEGVVYYNHTIEHELKTDSLKEVKDIFRLKCMQYADRAKKLRLRVEEYIQAN